MDVKIGALLAKERQNDHDLLHTAIHNLEKQKNLQNNHKLKIIKNGIYMFIYIRTNYYKNILL